MCIRDSTGSVFSDHQWVDSHGAMRVRTNSQCMEMSFYRHSGTLIDRCFLYRSGGKQYTQCTSDLQNQSGTKTCCTDRETGEEC